MSDPYLSAALEALNAAASLVWSTSWHASLLVACVLGIRAVLRNRLAAAWKHALWVIILVRLLNPAVPEWRWNPFSLASIAPTGTRVAGESPSTVPRGFDTGAPSATSRLVPSKATTEKAEQTKRAIIVDARRAIPSVSLSISQAAGLIIWIMGVAFMATVNVVGAVQLRRTLGKLPEEYDPNVLELLKHCMQEVGVRRQVVVRVSPGGFGPALAGVLRPCIVLPAAWSKTLSTDQLRFVFLHELIHVRRWDVLLYHLWAVARCVHWCNPVVWFAMAQMRTDCELACDAAVLRLTGPESVSAYGGAILSLVETFARRPLLGTIGVSQSRRTLQSRIAMIADYRRPTARTRLVGIATAALLAALGLTRSTDSRAAIDDDVTQTRSADNVQSGSARIHSEKNGMEAPAKPAGATIDSPTNARATSSALLKLTIQLLDSEGKAVAGASVGTGGYGDSGQNPRWSLYAPSAESNSEGFAKLQLDAGRIEPVILYALSKDKRLTGFKVVPNSGRELAVDMTLLPACCVTGRLTSSEFKELGRPMDWTNVYLFSGKHRPLSFSSRKQEFEFFLPPGEYRAEAYGTHLQKVSREIDVRPGQSELQVGDWDLPASKLVKLFGKPAPELREIKGWQNGGAVTLEALRGRVVVLDFWGYWCGPCVREIPDWMALYDNYQEHGLVVIGVHDDSLADVAELDAKLKSVRERRWWGRSIPYLVALDGGGKTRIERTETTARGATTAAYGITTFPTGILIDREGRIVGDFYPNSSESINTLRRLLGLKPVEDPFVMTPTPTWKSKIESDYKLSPRETIRRIAPPFIAERTQFITDAFNRRRGDGGYPARLTVYYDDGRLSDGSDGPARVGDLLRSLAPWGKPDDIFDCPRELAKLELPGDWVVRKQSSLEERLRSLEPILAREFDQKIRFELRKVEREVIVVTGRYKLTPLSGSNVDRVISLTADVDDNFTEYGGGTGSIDDFLGSLSRVFQCRIIDEQDDAPKASLEWRQRKSAILGRSAEDRAKADLILANLERQTSLKFKRERRRIDVWFVLSDE